jgi:competence protein CoiA-like protein
MSVTQGAGLRLPFGLSKGQLVSPAQVERGAACGCTCPACGMDLVAKKGLQRAHHFAHASGTECAHGVETALHLAAKEAIAAAQRLWVPEVTLDVATPTAWVISQGQYVPVDEVVLEQREGDVVPDVAVTSGGRRFFVEIAVTHKVGAAKRERLRAKGMSTLEIALPRHYDVTTLDSVADIVVAGTEHKEWVVNVRRDRVFARVVSTALRLPVVVRGLSQVDDCPKAARRARGKAFAYLVDDCSKCQYRLTATRQEVFCLGRPKIRSYAEWKEWRKVRARINNVRGE